jgi:hypothetical protein
VRVRKPEDWGESVVERLTGKSEWGGARRWLPGRLLATVLLQAACAGDTAVAPELVGAAALEIAEVRVAALAAHEATVVFSTDQLSLSDIAYGTSPAYGAEMSVAMSPATHHEVVITGLTPATMYHFRVTAHDDVLATVDSATGTFTTEPASATPDGQPPVISQVGTRTVSAENATVTWTTDEAAVGRVEYGTSSSYGSASAPESAPTTDHALTLASLTEGTTYHFRVTATDAAGNQVSSGDQTFTTSHASGPEPGSAAGIWIGPSEISQLSMSGPAWDNLISEASGACGLLDLANQEQTNNVCIMAKALAYARTGDARHRADVLTAIGQVVALPLYLGRALALGRELPAYVIAADIIGLRDIDPTLDAAFRVAIRALLVTPTLDGPANLVECHERRPNNWGTHCGASRAAVAAYLGDTAMLARVAQVFKGWLGDRTSYAGFSYGDLSWQCDPARPVGINPAGCMRDGHSIDGVIADDQRRAGGFVWPPQKENYVWEALQGALVQAVILHRAGYQVWDWEDAALMRAVRWLHDQDGYPAEADDTWQPHILNHFYGSSFPAPVPASPGKNVGWSDWTHR